MKPRTSSSIAVILAILLGTSLSFAGNHATVKTEGKLIKKAEFKIAMRKLWQEHVVWTRLYIISALSELPDKEETTKRLLQNQTDIGNAVKGFYGDAAGDKLTSLLKDHILIAADLVDAVGTGNTERSNQASAKWNTNADAIAEFLSGANPKYWPLNETKSMMHEHLKATTDEVLARVKKDWQGDVKAYDRIENQILEMADMLSSGIIGQFHTKFS
jgi:hypothetical protein